MTLVAFGINHKTAPVDIREKVPVKIMIYDWDDNLIENTDMKI